MTERAMRGNRLFGLLDQGLSSAQNFALLVIVARQTSAQDFGAFSVAIAAALLVIGLGQAVFGEAALIRLGSDVGPARTISGGVLGLVMVLAVLVGMTAEAISMHLGGTLKPLFELLGPAALPLLLQDGVRFLLIGQGRARAAFVSDAAWVLSWLGTAAALSVSTAASHFAVWAGTSAVGAIVGIAALRPRLSMESVRIVGRDFARLSGSLLLEWVFLTGSVQLVVFALAAIVGLPATGGLRAAQSLFGPVSTLVNAVRLVFVREFAEKAAGNDLSSAAGLIALISFVNSALAALVVTAGIMLPTAAGYWLYGATWDLAKPLLLVIGLQRIAHAATTGAWAYLRGSGRIIEAIRATIVGVAIEAVLAISLAPWGIVESSFGLLTGTLAAAGLTWVATARALQSPQPPPGQTSIVTGVVGMDAPTMILFWAKDGDAANRSGGVGRPSSPSGSGLAEYRGRRHNRRGRRATEAPRRVDHRQPKHRRP
jgi:O-antigen/teichoic acid export membrane protein